MSANRARPRVAVLGAGIMGSSTALFLARAGCQVTLIDRAPSPMNGASRWNEGKIHLGFLYAGDPSGRTAAELIEGGLEFRTLTEELIGCSLAPHTAPEDDIYLVHPKSVVSAAAMAAYFGQVESLIEARATAGQYLAPIGKVEPFHRDEIEALTGGAVQAGFRVPERSVNTVWLADRFAEAIQAEANITLLTRTVVSGINSLSGSPNELWRIEADPAIDQPFDFVVNALWEGRLAIDRSVNLQDEADWSHRFRVSLFVRTRRRLELPCLVLATGPFGDVKNYDGTHFYLSWYPAGLVAEGNDVEPPKIGVLSPEDIIDATRRGLLTFFPAVKSVFDHADDIQVQGGWVFARGRGSLLTPESSLHRRDRFGIDWRGTYVSVDTGKYSVAPWLAKKIAAKITGDR